MNIPIFFSDGLQLTYIHYRLHAIVYHIGELPYSGHYKAALSVAGNGKGDRGHGLFALLMMGVPRDLPPKRTLRRSPIMHTSASFVNAACMIKSIACADSHLHHTHLRCG